MVDHRTGASSDNKTEYHTYMLAQLHKFSDHTTSNSFVPVIFLKTNIGILEIISTNDLLLALPKTEMELKTLMRYQNNKYNNEHANFSGHNKRSNFLNRVFWRRCIEETLNLQVNICLLIG